MSGHVFVTHGDLTALHCDAWLLPTDTFFSVTAGFREHVSPALKEHLRQLWQGDLAPPARWSDDDIRVAAVPEGLDALGRRPYLVNVGGLPGHSVAWYLEAARQFFAAVAANLQGTAPATGRPLPLVALPFIGTGSGGAAAIKGSVVRDLIGALFGAAHAHDLDIILVTNNAPAFLSAQNARRRYLRDQAAGGDTTLAASIAPDLASVARELAHRAASGSLVLFIGAGVSRAAGLPSWAELLTGLAEDAVMEPRERDALHCLDDLDKARIIEDRLARRGVSLGEAVSTRLQAERYSLAHSLLAALPVGEVVTTNYDVLFEAASAAAGREVAVLPYQPVVGRRRWLLKMHGCVNHPEDIVLTREHFLRYTDTRAALAGIVQALLITRHMLFIGFSLRDDNFHQIVDDVRKAIRGTGRQPDANLPFGTALLLQNDDLLAELWRRDLALVGMAGSTAHTDVEAARKLEIFLDTLLAEATRGASPLLDNAYEGILTEDEQELRTLLVALQAGATPELRQSPAWLPVADLLARLGGPSMGAWHDMPVERDVAGE